MLELDHLTVSGDVTFGKGVTLKVCGNEVTTLTMQTAVLLNSAPGWLHYLFTVECHLSELVGAKGCSDNRKLWMTKGYIDLH